MIAFTVMEYLLLIATVLGSIYIVYDLFFYEDE